MRNELTKLENLTITEIKRVHDYWQIYTDKGGININNPIVYIKFNKRYELTNSIIDAIIGKKIVRVKVKEFKFISLVMENKGELIISLLDDDYSCPEAMEIYLNSGEIIVIN